MRQCWPLDGHFEPGIDEAAQGNIAHAYFLARQVGLFSQSPFGHGQQIATGFQGRVDGGPVLLANDDVVQSIHFSAWARTCKSVGDQAEWAACLAAR